MSEAMLPYLTTHFGNPSSGHHYAEQPRRALAAAGQQVAHLIGAAPDEIVFTSGGSKAHALAIHGTVVAYPRPSDVNPSDPRRADAIAPDLCPVWVTLEIADPGRLSRLAWLIPEWQEQAVAPRLQFERGEIVLLISDQQPYNQQTPPQSLARAVPDRVTLVREGTELHVGVELGLTFAADAAQMRTRRRVRT